MRTIYCVVLFVLCLPGASLHAQDKLRALIVDGQNNHGMWPKTTAMMKHHLEQTGRFTVDVERTRYTWNGADLLEQYGLDDGKQYTVVPQPKPDPEFKPDFAAYDVVINNFGWRAAPWPEQTRKAFEAYVSGGGGLVVIHAANNAWSEWDEYNRMIGLGGWGGRDETFGPYVYIDDSGKTVRDQSPGRGGAHGPQHQYQIVVRDPDHPITRGLPRSWMHTKDELYERLRGPADNMTILATAYADEQYKGSGRHEPMLMTIEYGQGRVFHTAMGHADYSVAGVGFLTTLARGAEWAATGEVTLTDVPSDFPTANEPSAREFD